MKNTLFATILALTLALALPTAALAAAPSNDNRAGAETITTLPFSDSTLINDATTEAGEPTDCESGKSVWYRHRAPRDGVLVASTAGSNYNTSIAIYEGTLAAMSLETCEYNYGGRGVGFEVLKDHTYFIKVAATESDRVTALSELKFALRRQPTITTTIDDRAWSSSVNNRGTATGLVKCPPNIAVTLNVSMSQKVPGGIARASKATYLTCDGAVRWQANMKPATTLKFINGPATVAVRMSAPSESMSSTTKREVRLRTCTLIGSVGADTLRGTAGNDRICALAGDDTIETRGGADKVYSGPGADVVNTGAGKDFVYGDEGADTIRLGTGNDVGRGDAGRDRLYGQSGDDTLYGGAQADLLNGGTGPDRCIGGTGRDSFRSCAVKRQ